MKKKIALVAGGYSGEAVVSLASAHTIQQNLDKEKYETFLIVIDKHSWRYRREGKDVTDIDKNDFSIQENGQKITFDLALIAIHGSPGEDGKLQGYFDLIGMPYTTCNTLVSSLTFNKSFCNELLRSYNVTPIAKSVILDKKRPYSLGSVLESLTLPVFVKPNESGSSLGVSKVTEIAEILPAIEKAFEESTQVLIEEYIEGTELTIGVYNDNGTAKTLPPTEVVSKNAFFDFEAKYTIGISDEITPARITEEVEKRLRATAESIYDILHCAGVVRIDFILQKNTGKLYFLEVNTVPGQSANSLIPKQVAAQGMSLKTFYGNLVESFL